MESLRKYKGWLPQTRPLRLLAVAQKGEHMADRTVVSILSSCSSQRRPDVLSAASPALLQTMQAGPQVP